MGPSSRRRLKCIGYDFLDLVVADFASYPRSGLVVKPLQSLRYKATPPLANRAPHRPQLCGHFHIRQTIRAMQYDLGSERLVPRTPTAFRQPMQRNAFFRCQRKFCLWPASVCHKRKKITGMTVCLAFSDTGH